MKDWNTMPTSSLIFLRSVFGSVTSIPSILIDPLVGSSSLFTLLSRVDFPEPLGPIMTTTSPSLTVSVACFTACTVLIPSTEKSLQRSVISILAIVLVKPLLKQTHQSGQNQGEDQVDECDDEHCLQ